MRKLTEAEFNQINDASPDGVQFGWEDDAGDFVLDVEEVDYWMPTTGQPTRRTSRRCSSCLEATRFGSRRCQIWISVWSTTLGNRLSTQQR